jgi:hypothetical protein
MKNKMLQYALSVIGAVIVVVVVAVISMYFSYSNREVRLRNLAVAQEQANTVIFDKVWKVIAQKAQITDKYSKDFERIYVKIMDSRYTGKDNLLMNWIQEQNPVFDPHLYSSLMDTVAGQREEFSQVQIKLRDIKREHDNLRTTVPAKWFVGTRPELIVIIVTSADTSNVFKTAQENSIQVFK